MNIIKVNIHNNNWFLGHRNQNSAPGLLKQASFESSSLTSNGSKGKNENL